MSVNSLCPLKYPLRDDISDSYTPCKKNEFLCGFNKKCQGFDDLTDKGNIFAFGMQQYDKKGKKCITKTQIKIKSKTLNDFSLINILQDKQTASPSTIAFGIHKKTQHPVVLKAFTIFPEYPSYNNVTAGLIHEVEMYRKMETLAQKIPHFVNMVATYTIPYYKEAHYAEFEKENFFIKQHEIAIKSVLTAEGKQALTSQYLQKAVHEHVVLITTQIKGPTFFEYFSKIRSVEIIESIMFQLLFCLHAMLSLGFQHNDLHSKNILIDERPECHSALYMINGQMYDVNLPVKLYIFDFDEGSCNGCRENEFLKPWCFTYGICQKRNAKFDIYTIFRHMYDLKAFQHNEDAMVIINGILGPTNIDNPKLPYRFNPNNYKDDKQPVSVMLPADAIKKYFEPKKVEKHS